MDTHLFGFDVEIDASRLDVDDPTLRDQLDEYRAGDRLAFDATVAFPDGLTGDVMRAMLAIPPGRTRSYGAVADELGTAAVAVGQACGRNPVPVVVPCHRIVGADSIGGFSAAGGGRDGVALKRRLLEHEATVAAASASGAVADGAVAGRERRSGANGGGSVQTTLD